ncbi:MAG: prepilin-type N-terminal cleavage/methylation domain-containing protein [Pseudomonadota bacterium]|nr:prepilin-type N-terminal cleavage/methylation domain-containing protein [Pseudomonadota bacterium]
MNRPAARRQRGTSLLEVLITMVLLAFGLLGIAALQAKAQVGSIEAYQRAQAVLLLEDLQARINGNSGQADAYLSAGALGTGDALPADCSTVAAGSARDLCEWSGALKGAAELQSSTKVGAMVGARGCVSQVQAKDASAGVCTQGVYLITVAWQGLHPTLAPALACGKDLYGADTLRRAISVRVAVGLPNCI